MQVNSNSQSSDSDQYHQDQGKVLQKDYRKYVKNKNIHPYISIGKVICKFYISHLNKYFQKIGTGSIVAQNIVLTCAHVIYYKEMKLIANEIYFQPYQYFSQKEKINSIYQDTLSKEGIRVQKILLMNSYFQSNENKNISKDDFAFLKLQKNNLIKKNQILKINFEYDFDENKNKSLNISSYTPSNFHEVEEYPEIIEKKLDIYKIQFYQQRLANKQKDGFLYYQHTTYSGNSGGSVLMRNQKDQYEIIGIHKGAKSNYNYCVLLKTLKQQAFGNQISSVQLLQIINGGDLQINWKHQVIIMLSPQGNRFNLGTLSKQKQESAKHLDKDLIIKNSINKNIKNIENISILKPLKKPLVQQVEIKNKLKLLSNNTIQPKELFQLFKQAATVQNNQNNIKKYLMLIFKKDSEMFKLRYLINADRKLYFAHESQHFNVQLSPQGYTLHLSNVSHLNWNVYNLFTNKNWNHIQHLSLQGCPLFDKGWVNFVQNYKLFRNLKWLQIGSCQIETIRQGDMERLQSIRRVDFIYLETELKKQQSNKIIVPVLPLDSDKKLLIESMQKLINHISTDLKRQNQILFLLNQMDLKKIISNMSEQNQYLRKKSGFIIALMLYNNDETKKQFMKAMQIQLLEGRVCINQIPFKIKKNKQNSQKIIQLIKSPLKQQESNKFCWFINLDRKILQIQYLDYNKSKQFNFLDPLYCIFGFNLIDEKNLKKQNKLDKKFKGNNLLSVNNKKEQKLNKNNKNNNSLNKRYLESVNIKEEQLSTDYLVKTTNPLTNKSKKVLDNYKQTHPQVIVIYSQQCINFYNSSILNKKI